MFEPYRNRVIKGIAFVMALLIVASHMFVSSIRGNVYPYKWMCIINPLVMMILCIVLSKILSQNSFINGVFGFGQQIIGLFTVFLTLLLTCESKTKQSQS